MRITTYAQERLTVPPVHFFREHPTIVIALCLFTPTIAISALGWLYADGLRSVVPVDLTSLSAVRVLFRDMLHGSMRQDSWGPMLQALGELRGGKGDVLYQTLFFSAHVRFQYPPTSLLPLDLLSVANLASVRALNAINTIVCFLNAAATGCLAWLLFEGQHRAAVRGGRNLRTGGMVAIAVAAALTFYPIVRADLLGQIQLWIDLLFTCTLIAWVLERRLLAGVLIGLACTIKPQFALLLIWGLLWRQWAFSGGILAGVVPMALVSLFCYGLNAHLGYLQVLAFLSRHGESFFANNSINGILNGYLPSINSLVWDSNRLTPYSPLVYAGTLTASVVALAAIVFAPLLNRKARPDIADLAIASICTVIGSPVAWEHHYGVLLPIYGVALKRVLELSPGSGRSARLACLIVSWMLVANVIPFANLLAGTPFSALQAHHFFGALLLVALLVQAGAESPTIRAVFAGQRD
jgi:alpha-1,2-mannosyltransferase